VKNIGGKLSVLAFSSIVLIPLFLALDRLVWVAGFDPVQWFSAIEANHLSQGSVGFTFLQAILSTIATIVIGLPIAWQLGRYKWRGSGLMRAILTMPFVIPSIIAAMGFLAFVGPHGMGFRADQDTHLWTLIIAHAWFNMALVIRFTEPVLSTLDRDLEDQLRLLPAGKTLWGKLRNLWIPLLTPSIAAAACMTFIFSFTSFALVRWITPLESTLETVLADVGERAGISGYEVYANDLVLASSLIQFTVMLASLWLMSWLQERRQSLLPQASENSNLKANPRGLLILVPGLFFALAPLVTVAWSSLRIPVREQGELTYHWGVEGWVEAWSGGYSNTGVGDALLNSLGYAGITLIVALPLGWSLAKTIHELELSKSRWSRFLDVFTMLPFAFSAVMIGLGVLLGILKLDGELNSLWLLPVLPHIMLTTPFVVRIMLPAFRGLDPSYDEGARILGLSQSERFWKIRLPLLRGPLLVAITFTLAMSLGEFGASWVVARSGEWDTLPVLIDSLRSRTGWDPLIQPTAAAAATTLMLITLLLFMTVERFRPKGEGGMF